MKHFLPHFLICVLCVACIPQESGEAQSSQAGDITTPSTTAVADRLQELGSELPEVTPPLANYVNAGHLANSRAIDVEQGD